jgi:hypothetical protein
METAPVLEVPQSGQKVGWRDPEYARALGWADAYGPGPFEVLRAIDRSGLGLPAAVVLQTALGEREINEVWLEPAPVP